MMDARATSAFSITSLTFQYYTFYLLEITGIEYPKFYKPDLYNVI